jgi:prepilin peptidase CpaA
MLTSPEWTAVALGAAAAATDLRFRRIPRWLTAPAFLLGLMLHAFLGGFFSALGAAALGLALGLLLLQLGAVAGGDVKLLAAMGALLGLKLWFWSVNFGLLVAALVALAQLVVRGRMLFVAADVAAIVRGWFKYGFRPNPEHNIDAPGAVTAPFGVAMGIGVVCALLLF